MSKNNKNPPPPPFFSPIILNPFGQPYDPNDDLFADIDVDDFIKDVDDLLDKPRKTKVQCDCGSVKTYGENTNIHAHWCSLKTNKK